MAEYSSFFNSFQGDRRYTAAQFVEYFASFIGNGVYWGGDALKVNAIEGMDVRVEIGKAFVNGYYYKNEDAYKRITLEPADPTMPRIDRAVLRLDLSQAGRLVHATIKTGTPSSTPEPPILRRDNAYYELGLADIRVNAGVSRVLQSNITDLRLDAEMCGVVVGLVNQPDLTEIFNQYQAKYNEVETHWDDWFPDAQRIFNGWFAQIKAELYAQANTDFDDWSCRSGYDKITTFLIGGNINEEIVNHFNSSVLASRFTEFPTDGSVVETLTFYEPPLKVVKVTTFTDDQVIEGITEVTTP